MGKSSSVLAFFLCVMVLLAAGCGFGPRAADPAAAHTEVIDYNCNLPGTGCPWLQQTYPGLEDTDAGPDVERPTFTDAAHLKGFFRVNSPTAMDLAPYLMWLPARLDASGKPASMAEVYELMCRVHPDLGGSGLRLVDREELRRLALAGGVAIDEEESVVQAPVWYTDDTPRAADEAHLFREPYRLYMIYPLAAFPGMREWLSARNCAPAAKPGPSPSPFPSPTSTPTEETQRWQVSVSGFEFVVLDPYADVKGLNFYGGVRFDYDLAAEVVLVRKDGKWVYDRGEVSYASIQISPQYGPPGAWEIDLPLSCPRCGRLSAGRHLGGEVFGDELLVKWGVFHPEVNVYARLLDCPPDWVCPKEKTPREYESEEFVWRINEQWLRLVDGGSVSSEPVIRLGTQTLGYTVTLRRMGE